MLCSVPDSGKVGREVQMTRNIFRKPVWILVGFGYPREIRDPLDAVVYLNEVPAPSRNDAYRVALNACQAAVMGDIEAATARSAFETYAAKQDILAPASGGMVAASAVRRHGSHTT